VSAEIHVGLTTEEEEDSTTRIGTIVNDGGGTMDGEGNEAMAAEGDGAMAGKGDATMADEGDGAMDGGDEDGARDHLGHIVV
jgi:hypothetical protein